ncbi:MAG: N-acetylmuramoyl-L-alanine amidase [Pseudomonadota bacterium]
MRTGAILAVAVWWLAQAAAFAGPVTLELEFELPQATPYRVSAEEMPPSLFVDLAEAEGLAETDLGWFPPEVTGYRITLAPDGWQRIAFDLSRPHDVQRVVLDTGEDPPVLRVGLAALADFVPPAADPPVASLQPQAPRGDPRPLVALDPGHGGIDAGAVRENLREADLTLSFARELSEILIRSGRFRVMLTRTDDSYLRLGDRVSRARAAGAAALISLHADALEEGKASGTVVYTLSEEATDDVSRELVVMHDRSDVLGGVDLTGAGDDISGVLVELARRRTDPMSRALAEALVGALGAAEINLNSQPNRAAAFSVLKAADIPSVLVELGFMSDPGDLKKLQDPAWRSRAAEALGDGVIVWADSPISGLTVIANE